MATVWNISNMEHFSLGLFGHFKYFIVFKCPNSNRVWFNSDPKFVMEKCASPLATVYSISHNDEHFWKPFGLTENILGEPSEFL